MFTRRASNWPATICLELNYWKHRLRHAHCDHMHWTCPSPYYFARACVCACVCLRMNGSLHRMYVRRILNTFPAITSRHPCSTSSCRLQNLTSSSSISSGNSTGNADDQMHERTEGRDARIIWPGMIGRFNFTHEFACEASIIYFRRQLLGNNGKSVAAAACKRDRDTTGAFVCSNLPFVLRCVFHSNSLFG